MSDYVQQSFIGGMNLLAEDTRIASNQYRIGYNLRNRNDVLEPVLSSALDTAAPVGLKQELITFGEYIILFVAGKAYYRHHTATGWKQITGFSMSTTAPRLWTQEVPLATTNYLRSGILQTGETDSSKIQPNAGIILGNIAAAFAGNLPGLVVQDNINQPKFIYLDSTGYPVCRVTQKIDQWSQGTGPSYTDDAREYVPIGNAMAWVDGILYIVSQDFTRIYRSVSGRPLDFMVAVDASGDAAGTADDTAYSVGVSGISCLREMSNSTLFVGASNANFMVSKNMTQNAPTIFGEYTFIRTFLFNATCLSDRVILDSIGDTRFIDLTGVRSFNAIRQEQNEGRNSAFTSTIQDAFNGIVQDAAYCAAILYDNYELYAVNTIFGPAIAVYDTINQCWSSFDVQQTGGKRVKMLAKIELSIQRLFAVTEDNQLYTLYIGPSYDVPKVRPISASSGLTKDERGYGVDLKGEIKLTALRCVFNKITEDCTVVATPFVNNRLTSAAAQTKLIDYSAPVTTVTGELPDINTQLSNILFTFPNCGQGWKAFCQITWTDGVLTQFSYSFNDLTPANPLISQGNTR